ncbi:MAG: hypothetical protein HOD63_02155, partial [Bacteroidetes bacterium]|nr:hypothetical protein [Bacteroidota bacterium]
NEFISESDSIISYKTSETNYKLKRSFVIQPILKYGINYQLSLKDNFLNRFSLSIHGNYGAEFRFSNSFEKLSTYSRGISFGLKYSFLPIQSSKPIKLDKDNVNTKLTLKPILGFKLFDDYNGQYAIIKGVIYSVPVFGVELFNNRNNISFELRRHVFLKTFGEDTIASFSMVNSTTILSVNYKIKDGFYKNCRFGIGPSYFNFKDMNSSTLNPYYANSLGFSSFFSFPLKWIDIEIRNETIVWPDIHLFETHNWSINLVYRFGK